MSATSSWLMPVPAPAAGPVLVVDDDESIREMLIEVLTYEGYRVASARDGMEALAAVERERPSVVLLDLLMPMLDGRSVANVLRDNGVRVPIVVMTASDAAGSREVSMDGYLSKPFDLQEILAAVRRFHPLHVHARRAS